MKNLIISFIAIAGLINNKNAHAQKASADTAAVIMTDASVGTPKTTADDLTFNGLLQAYYGIKNALTADDAKLAQTEAKDLLVKAKVVAASKPVSQKQTVWKAHAEEIQDDAKQIAGSADINHQRDLFSHLSKAFYEVMKGAKLKQTIIYEQYCPMKNATWLSESSEIKNPYYGKQMSTCGTVKEKLGQVSK